MTLPAGHEDKLTSDAFSSIARTSVSESHPLTIESSREIRTLTTSPGQTVHDLLRVTTVICDAVGEQNFVHWFHNRVRFSIAGDRLYVRVPNPFILNWMLRRFRAQLNQAAQVILGPSGTALLEVAELPIHESVGDSGAAGWVAMLPVNPGPLSDLTVSNSSNSSTSSAENAAPVTDMAAIRFDPAMTPPHGLVSSQSSGHVVGGSGPNSGTAGLSAGSPRSVTRRLAPPSRSSAAGPNRGIPDQPSALQLPSGRRRFRSFESFVSGECNDLAVLAARQISAAPGDRYNPLFIYGGTGTGKTHLLEAIYTEVRRSHPTKNVMYLTSEAFTNYFTSALNCRTVPSFRQRFRNVEVLLIDNIEFLDNKRATQEEFLHTIVQLIDHGGQVVISSDRHPRLLTKHREELTTRFLSGLVCRIESPDETTRLKLVRSLTVGMNAVFSDDVLDYIVRRCRRNIRELQGALNQLEGHFALTGRRITLTLARDILGEMADECRRLVRISDVEKLVCDVFGVTTTDLRSATRRKAIAIPRAIAMFMSRRMTRSAYREIGLYFGGRDHSTVVAAEKKVAEWIATGSTVGLPVACSGRTFAELVDELELRLQTLAS